MIDLVVDHTSDQHPWLQEARRDPKSKYRAGGKLLRPDAGWRVGTMSPVAASAALHLFPEP